MYFAKFRCRTNYINCDLSRFDAMGDAIETFEAETQLLGTSPVAFVDAVINAVNDYAYDASEQMLKALLASDPQLDPVAMRRVVNKLLSFVQDQIDKYYDKYELFCLTNVLKIPSHVKLPTDLVRNVFFCGRVLVEFVLLLLSVPKM